MKQAELHPQSLNKSHERLESWKEIAAFLGKGVRTVQRWERTEELPVRRHVHERGGTVYAYKSEILDWYRSRQTRLDAEEPEPPTQHPSPAVPPPAPSPAAVRMWDWRLLALAVLGIASLGLFFFSRTRPNASLTTTVLSVVGRASQAVLSPDGQRIAFSWNGNQEFGNLDLYIMDASGQPPRRLTDDPNNEHSPAWSPDGRAVAFLRDNAGVFVITADGGPVKQLLPAGPGATYGVGMTWTPDGRSLFFSERTEPGKALAIYRVSEAGGLRERVTTPPEWPGDMYPAVSVDGRRLAFMRQARSLAARVYVAELAGGARVVHEPAPLAFESSRIAGLDWLPGSHSIVVSSDRSGGRRLWRVPARSWLFWRSPQPLPFAGEEAFQPSVARNSGSLLYSRRYWPSGVWKVDLGEPGAAAADPVKIVASVREDLEPAWSPDGRHIAFVSTRTGHTEIWVSAGDGSGAMQLTSFSGALTHAPAWSPDGKWIAFHSGPETSSSIFVVPAGGGETRRVTPEDMHSRSAAWSRDGAWIYFASDRSGAGNVWKVVADGGAPAQVTSSEGSQPKISPDGRWLYFRRDGLRRIAVSGGGEELVFKEPVGTFVVGAQGVYFDRGHGDYVAPELYYHDFSTRRTRLVTRFDRRKSAGLSLSPDGRHLLVPLKDRQSSELLMTSVAP